MRVMLWVGSLSARRAWISRTWSTSCWYCQPWASSLRLRVRGLQCRASAAAARSGGSAICSTIICESRQATSPRLSSMLRRSHRLAYSAALCGLAWGSGWSSTAASKNSWVAGASNWIGQPNTAWYCSACAGSGKSQRRRVTGSGRPSTQRQLATMLPSTSSTASRRSGPRSSLAWTW
ncbi:hypothetical protein D3C78_1379910 [compost metagenome]